jgi:hypothetical protein
MVDMEDGLFLSFASVWNQFSSSDDDDDDDVVGGGGVVVAAVVSIGAEVSGRVFATLMDVDVNLSFDDDGVKADTDATDATDATVAIKIA